MRAAIAKIRIPAGTKRTPAKKNGVVWGITPFIATMAVPQRKKGAIKSNGAEGNLDSESFSMQSLQEGLGCSNARQ